MGWNGNSASISRMRMIKFVALLTFLANFCSAQGKGINSVKSQRKRFLLDYGRGMFISGYATDQFDAGTDVLDFDEGLNLREECAIPDLPRPNSGMVSVVWDGKILACGGHQVATCYTYNPIENIWTEGPALPENRFSPAAFVTGDGRFVMVGGRNEEGDSPTVSDTAFVLEPGTNEFVVDPSLTMPYPIFAHCTVPINGTHVFLVGGATGEGSIGRAFILNLEANNDDDR